MDSRKWPDRRHWQYSMNWLGEDDHGAWLVVPADTLAQRGDEAPRPLRTGFVTLVPRSEWWVVEFYWNHPRHSAYVNIGTPPAWHGERVQQVDLDLDVVRKLDGTVEILDEDEFRDNQVRYGYPPDLALEATAACGRAAEMIKGYVEPFAVASHEWLAIGSEHPTPS